MLCNFVSWKLINFLPYFLKLSRWNHIHAHIQGTPLQNRRDCSLEMKQIGSLKLTLIRLFHTYNPVSLILLMKIPRPLDCLRSIITGNCGVDGAAWMFVIKHAHNLHYWWTVFKSELCLGFITGESYFWKALL